MHRKGEAYMNGSLGIYVGDKVVKYAMLSIDQEKRAGVEAVGTKFITTTKEDTIKEIVQETGSTYPISLNLKNETYENISLISKLSKSDMAKVIEIEFEDLCEKKGTNPKLFDKRYMVTEESDTGENNVLLVRSTKAQVEDIKNSAKGNNVAGIFPYQIGITNLVPPSESNYIILNLEEQTQIITVIKGKIAKLSTLNLGLSTILEKLSYELNSYSKAYEVCKSLNVYGDASASAAPEFEKIVEPILQDIIHRFEAQIIEYRNDIKKIFISGVGAMFANLDRLFEEYFQIKTELLKPHFLSPASMSSNLGEILEANSALSLAYELLEPSENKVLNFSAGVQSTFDIKDKMKSIFGGNKEKPVPSHKDPAKFPPKAANPIAAVGAAAVGTVGAAGAAVAGSMQSQATPMQSTVDLTAKSIFDDPATPQVPEQVAPPAPTNSVSDAEELADTVARMSSDGALDTPSGMSIPNLMNDEKPQNGLKKPAKQQKSGDSSGAIDKFKTVVINLSVVVACAIVAYIGVAIFFDTQIITAKQAYLDKVKEINKNILQIESDTNYVVQVTADYQKINEYVNSTGSMIENEEIGKLTTNNFAKFLKELANIMPSGASLTRITTNDNKNVVISARSKTYANLGYLVSRIKLDGTLKNIKINKVYHNAEISIEIGGDLP